MYYDELTDGMAVWERSYITNTYAEPIKNSDKDVRAVAVFNYPHGVGTVEFSMFTQNDILSTTEGGGDPFNRKTPYPTFELRGIVGDYPMLYKFTDNNRQSNMMTGPQNRILVDVDVNLMYGDDTIRSFDYSDCRTIDYKISVNPNSEEGYVKDSFTLENIFGFECQGYTPNNPIYDIMMNSHEKTDTTSTMDLKNTDDWDSQIYRVKSLFFLYYSSTKII